MITKNGSITTQIVPTQWGYTLFPRESLKPSQWVDCFHHLRILESPLSDRDRVKSGMDDRVGCREQIIHRSIYSEARKFSASGFVLVSSSTV